MPSASSRSSALRHALAAALLCAAGGAPAQDAAPGDAAAGQPVIREIVFRGNEVTQPVVMLREMAVHVGDPADPAAIERSRQGVQDLGLFRSVAADTEPVDGGVRLVIKVKEKLYVLPFPRVSANSDGGYGYGMQLTWNNVWGMNHTFRPYFERRQPSEGDADPEKRGLMTRSQVRYTAPFAVGRFGFDLWTGHYVTPYLEPLEYEQKTSFLWLMLTRKLGEGPSSRGWTGQGGLVWADEVHRGPDAPTDPLAAARGRVLSALVGASYHDVRYNVYSDEGVDASFFVQGASADISSDYAFTSYGASYYRYMGVGSTPHQNLNFQLDVYARHDGRYGGDFYAVGGAESLRGFEPEIAKGDAYYVASVEYLRPVFRRSIRALAVIDAGNAFRGPGDANLDKVYVSLGLGVRARIQAFVGLDLELGVAWPLGGEGDGPRVFAAKVN